MTFQEPDELRNDSEVDLRFLRPYFFCDIDGDNASDTKYLPVQPKFPSPNEFCSSLWRGYIAKLHLHADGTLELLQFEFPYSTATAKPQTVNQLFTGDFCLVFRPFFSGPSTIVPFRSGIVRDRDQWLVDDQTMTAYVDDVVKDAGLRVTVCELAGFIPRSSLPHHHRDAMQDLIGREIKCKIHQLEDRHPPVFVPADFDIEEQRSD